MYESSICGPTGEDRDIIIKKCFLPELEIGECIAFKNMGAYSLACGVPACGFSLSQCIYIVRSTFWDNIKTAFD
jgi:diaminopimelate decarboxylase